MKKQVTFAEGQTIHRLHQDVALQRNTRVNRSKNALKDGGMNFNSGLTINRPSAPNCEPQLQHEATIQIPKTMTAAPFLKHAALTPAQREYLYTIAASYSAAHVRDLITQHYMNVLHRCIQAGGNPERGDLVASSVTSPRSDVSDKRRSEVYSRVKHKERKDTSEKNPGKSSLPKISNRQASLSNTSASKQRKMKNQIITSPTLTRKSPRRARIRLLEDGKRDEKDDSLSECLSSLSVGKWDVGTLSDL
ncbi:protein FAM216A-like [Plectropomus leopardus]|uniref:protein FAM216A-like n=1 Tax=Plectropomus leopardus TaxID=160734 RepID=UPI001C4BB884|nr:protein FAM216A-like [Plectropomus leopardus]